MAQKINKCSTCEHFKNQQAALNYQDSIGFCTNGKFAFNTVNGRLVGVVDRENGRDRTKITGNPSHDVETISNSGSQSVQPSRYLLQVEEDFGCIFHEQKKEIVK